MSGIMMMVIAIVVLGGAYLLYGRYLQNQWGIDPKAKTPAYEMEDGVDYVPADTNVVFGHQFASIAASGTSLDPDRWCVLWSSSGLCIYVCLCKEQRTYNWIHY